MPTTLNFKPYIDLPMWRPEAPALAAVGAGGSFAWDHRNTSNGSPYQYLLRGIANFEAYDPVSGDWMALGSPGLVGAVGAGSAALFNPSQGPRGAIAAGSTASKVVLGTVLPASITTNQLANRGDGTGFRIRIIGNSAGSSGKIEERTIVANTAGTPTVILDSPLSFVPALGDTFEIRSGKVYLMAAGLQATGTTFKAYDIATNSYTTNLTAIPGTLVTDSTGLALSEAHVPWNRVSGEGFVATIAIPVLSSDGKKCIRATATTLNTITGSDMFTDLQANEYTNFQIRIVEDPTTPTAVNQRRKISSHTAGAAGAFTVAAWAVTPSIDAKFVVENDDNKMLFRSSAGALVYNYNIAENTWDTATWALPPIHGAGVVFEQGFGYERDVLGNARHSHLYCIRGGGFADIDVLDIAAGPTGVWTNNVTYGKKGQTFTTGTSGAYDPVTNQGRLLHLNINGTQRMARFDMKNRVMDAGTYLRYPPGLTVVGQRLCNGVFIDGDTKVNLLYQISPSQSQVFSLVIQ